MPLIAGAAAISGVRGAPWFSFPASPLAIQRWPAIVRSQLPTRLKLLSVSHAPPASAHRSRFRHEPDLDAGDWIVRSTEASTHSRRLWR